MAEFPTVGLKVDLTGIDAGGKAYDALKGKIADVGNAADTTTRKVQASATAAKTAADSSVQATATSAAASTKATRGAAAEEAAAAQQRTQIRRNLQQMEIAAIQAEEAARRAAHADVLALATEQSRIISAATKAQSDAVIAADRAATAEQARNADYLLKVRLASFKMQETASQKAALAQIKADDEATAAAIASAERRAAAAAAAAAVIVPPSRAPGGPSAASDMADQIKAQEAAYLAESVASRAATTERDVATASMAKAAAATAPLVTGLDAIAVSMAKQMNVSVDEARAILNVTRGYEGMFPALNGVTAATDEYAVRADKLRAALIPGAAAQQLLATRTAEANELLKAGAITQAEYATAMATATKVAEVQGSVVGGTSIKIRESIVLIREFLRGDFSRMAGSASILFNAFVSITAELVTMVALVAALAAPFVLLAFAALKGEQEISKFNGALIATGNYAGLTQGSLQSMSDAIAKSSDTTIGSTKAVVESLAESGKFSAASIANLSDAAENYSRITHENATKFATEYEGMKDNLVKFAVKHEDTYHDLTLAEVEQIYWLQKHGQETAAQELLAADIDKTSRQRKDAAVAKDLENMGLLQRAAHQAAIDFSAMWDALLGLGRPQTLDQKIADATDAVMKAGSLAAGATRAGNANPNDPSVKAARAASYDAAVATLRNLNAQKAAEDAKAAAAAAEAKKNHDEIQAKFGAGKTPKGPKPPSFEGAIDGIARTERQIEGLKAEINSLSADPLTVLNAQIIAAGNTAAAALESGKKQNQGLADKQRALATDKERLTITKQMITANVAATRQNDLQTDSETLTATAQLKSVQVMKDFWSGSTPTLQTYMQALDKSRQITTDAAVAVSDLGIAERYGVKDLDDISGALVDAGVANADYAQKVEDSAKVEAAAAAARIRQKAALDALASKDTDIKAFNDTSYAQLQRDLTSITNLAGNLGTSLAAAFGQGGTALQGLLSAMTTFSTKQVALNKQLADAQVQYNNKVIDGGQLAKVQEQVASASAQNQIEGYASMAAAAEGFFTKGSAGYQLMQKVSMAFRLIEFANSAKSIVVGAAETAAKLGFFGAQAQAAAVAGAANMFATLGPAGFAAAAAMVAVLAGLGLALSGGAGGGAVPGANDMANRQKAQGSGSVLGDAAAKSASIADSLTLVAANTNKSLQFENKQLSALQSIDANISTLTNQLAQQLQLSTGAFSTTGLNLGSSTQGPGLLTRILSPISNLLPGLFGSKTTNTLQDQGINLNSASLSSILQSGISGNTYAQVASEVKKQFLGITYSDKTSSNTTTGTLDPAITGQINAVIASLRSGVLQAAGQLGITGAQAALDAMTVSIGSISFKDMTGAQIQSTLEAVFGKLGDQMATIAAPFITSLQKTGEGAFETLERVAHDYQVLDVTLSSIGLTFGAVGVASLAARENLITLSGGLDNLTSQVGTYATTFLTAQQQITPVIKAVYTALGQLGYGSITTKAQFVDLVNSLDLTTAAGAQTFATLMNIAPAFAQITDYMAGLTAANSNVATAQTALNDAYNSSVSVITTAHDKFAAFVTSLKAFRATLETGPLAALSPQDQYNKTKAIFQSTAAAAAGGDETALGNLQQVSQDYLTASKAYFASTEPYFADLAAVKAATDAAQAYAQSQVDIANQQLNALNSMVSGLITVNASVLSVADAIKGLQDAQAAQAAAIAAAQAAANASVAPAAATSTPSAVTAPSTAAGAGQIDYNQLLKDRPDVLAQYNSLIAVADKNSPWYAQHGLDKGATGFAAWWYNQGGGSAQYSQSISTGQALDTGSQIMPGATGSIDGGVVLPSSSAATSPGPSVAAGGQDVADALSGLTKEMQIGNVLAKSGFQATIAGLAAVASSTDDVAKQVRLQAA